MYIDKIDDLVDKIIDDFNINVIQKNLDKFTEVNFVKYQLDFNKLLDNYGKNINVDKITSDPDTQHSIVEVIKKYLAYYIFMIIAYGYKGTLDSYVINVIEFTKHQISFNFKVNNFFNSESNSNVIAYYQLIKHVIELLDADKTKYNSLIKKTDYKSAIDFLGQFDEEIIKALKIEKTRANNLIKIIILHEMFIKTDKKELYKLLEKTEETQGEYIYIDIVMPSKHYVDFAAIENAVIELDDRALVADIYKLLTDPSDIFIDKSVDDKINELISSGIMIPIVHDFLLYNKMGETYDKTENTDDKRRQSIKQKEDTKIKYIVNRIDSASELFNKNNTPDMVKNIEKIFYVPLTERRAVIINNNEDLNIISKMQNQPTLSGQSSEYYNDFMNYRSYPFINFKDMPSTVDGFNISVSKTITAARSISFEKYELNKNKNIQYRTCVPNRNVNIAGFILNTGRNSVLCNKIRNIPDIRRLFAPQENGYRNTLSLFDKLFTSNKKSYVYWMFNNTLDKAIMDKYESVSKLTKNEYTKLLISNLYDDITLGIAQFLIQNTKETSLIDFYKRFEKYAKLLDISEYSDVFHKYASAIVPDKIIQYKREYDKKQDIFYGLIGDIIKLPVIPKPEHPGYELIQVKKKGLGKEKHDDNLLELDQTAMCQHNLAWDQLVGARRSNISKFPDMLYNFITQYVIKNYENDYICRSCSTLVDLRDYVTDGSFDSDGRFVSYSVPFDVPIEDIPEYAKYKVSIRNIEKITEKLGAISNINTLTGTSRATKSRIRQIVKDVLELVLIHNPALKNVYKERSEKISTYGLSKDLSNLFVFELDNTIFTFSTKDKDLYKPIKRNNILMYIMFFVLLEVTDSQTIFMTGNKVCNYNTFMKYGFAWFNDIYIRKNNQATLVHITNYKLLCYMIFYMSCLITKYNMWQLSDSDEENDKKYNPNVNKIIVHTFIDLLNSIIEVFSRKKRNYMYDLIANRFFNKLNTMFSNDNLLNKIKEIESKTVIKKANTSPNKNEAILVSEYKPVEFKPTKAWRKCTNQRLYANKFKTIINELILTNESNCKTGEFHKWVAGKTIKCSVCNIIYDEIDLSKQVTELIQINNNKLYVAKRFKQYCSTHKCGSIDEYRKDIINIYMKRYKTLFIKPSKKEPEFPEISSEKGVKELIKLLSSIVGTEFNTSDGIIYLQQDMYVINHDHVGHQIAKPILFSKLIQKDNHTFFKKAVIQYTKGNLEMFYDANTFLYLGYKDKNNEYHHVPPRAYLMTDYSVESRLKMLGYPNKYINITSKKNELAEIFDDKQYILKQVLADSIRNRIDSLKKIINDMRRYINIIINNFDIQKVFSEDEPNDDDFLKKYIGKLDIKNSDIFKQYVSDDYTYQDITKTINIAYNDTIIEYSDISKYDIAGDALNNTIMENIIEFINNNQKNANVVYFTIDLIANVFNKYNNDAKINSDLKRFEYVLRTTGLNEVSKEIVGETEGFYGDYVDENDVESKEARKQKANDKEESESLDIDTMMDEEDGELRNEFGEEAGLDYEVDYLPGVNSG